MLHSVLLSVQRREGGGRESILGDFRRHSRHLISFHTINRREGGEWRNTDVAASS